MKNLELESEAIRISEFCHVICQILSMHKQLSIVKLAVFAYIVKFKNNQLSLVYSAKNENNLDEKIISILNGDYDNFCISLDAILKSIHLLILNKNCKIEDSIIYFVSKKDYEKPIYNNKCFIYKSIEYSQKIEDFQFLKEIVQNV